VPSCRLQLRLKAVARAAHPTGRRRVPGPWLAGQPHRPAPPPAPWPDSSDSATGRQRCCPFLDHRPEEGRRCSSPGLLPCHCPGFAPAALAPVSALLVCPRAGIRATSSVAVRVVRTRTTTCSGPGRCGALRCAGQVVHGSPGLGLKSGNAFSPHDAAQEISDPAAVGIRRARSSCALDRPSLASSRRAGLKFPFD